MSFNAPGFFTQQMELDLATDEHADGLPELRQRYKRLVEMLDYKLAKVNPKLFSDGRRPSIHDILNAPDFDHDVTLSQVYREGHKACFPTHIPEYFALHNLFTWYRDIEADKFEARKTHKHEHAAGAIWFWQLDKNHSFSLKHRQVLANVLLACIIEIENEAPADILAFVKKFTTAFVHYNFRNEDPTAAEIFVNDWCHHSEYDLVRFGSTKIKLVVNRVNALRRTVPKTSEEAREILRRSESAAFEHALDDPCTYALWWFLSVEAKVKETNQDVKSFHDNIMQDDDDFVKAFTRVGMDQDNMPEYVRLEHFDKPLVKALEAPVGRTAEHPWNIYPQEERKSRPWMDQNAALDKLLGDGLDKAFGSLQL